jgi:N-acetylmuramoyl-L-alanine amidase
MAARRAALIALSFSVLPGAVAQAGERLAVTDVRFWTLADATRIAIETSGEFRYRYDRLPNPDRLYFDVLGARWPLSRERIHVIPVGNKLLKQIRVTERRPGVTRVVLDLQSPVDFSAVQLANPDRLIIELRAASGTTLAKRAGKSPAKAATAEPPQPAEVRIPQPAKRNRTGSRSLVRALGLKLGTVVLDPGHGGRDTGTIGPTGLTEKELVLDIARRLGPLIEERLGAEVIYTRTDDVSVPLEERTALANQKKADLFLSIHANSGVRSATGAETYYLNFTTSRSALDVAARENASSEKTIHELQSLIQKIALKDKIEESREFAAKVQSALHAARKKTNRRARNRGVRKAPFLVLIGASMPSVLTEITFLSNPREERLLKRTSHRKQLAEALYKGLSQYAQTLSHFQVAERKVP